MSNFFKQAPAQDTYQKRFLEAVFHRQHVMASMPLQASTVSLYALAAMMGQGLTVAVCPGPAAIRRHLTYFRQAGFRFPDVAYLDGTQMPHEERAVYQEVNRNRVKILYVSADRFASLTFLEVLVHAPLTFLVIEEADRLLPCMPGYVLYKKFYEEGLSQLSKLPPVALMTPPLPPDRLEALAARLKLDAFITITCPPRLEDVDLTVSMRLTEHQKFQTVVATLSGHPEKGKLGRLDEPGSVLIQAAYPAQAEKLGASLMDYGFESVWITHFKKPPREQAMVMEVAASRPNTIVVNAGVDTRGWSPPEQGGVPRLIFWSPPLGLEDLAMQVFRQPSAMPGAGSAMQAMALYTKEDFQDAVQRLKPTRYLEPGEVRERLRALRQYRRWVLSEDCRLASMASFLEVTGTGLPPCGRCDRCLERRYGKKLIRRFLKRWLY